MRQPFQHLSIRKKLALALWGAASAAFLFSLIALVLFESLTLKRRAGEIMKPYAELVSVSAETAVAFQDPDRAAEILTTLRANPEILEAQIELADSTLLARYSNSKGPTLFSTPPVADGVYVHGATAELSRHLQQGGRLRILMGLSQVRHLPTLTLWMFCGGVTVMLALTAGLLALLRRNVVQPIASLAEITEQVRQRGDYQNRVPASGDDELGRLGQSFNSMMAAIQARDNDLRRLNEELEQRVQDRTAAIEAQKQELQRQSEALKAGEQALVKLVQDLNAQTAALASANQELGEANKSLALMNKELESFSYSVSHDLRSPLRIIDGFSKAVLEDYGGKLDEEGKENLQTIRSASQRMGRLIDDILRLSQVTRAPLKLTSIDLSELAREIADRLQKSEPERNVEIVIAPGCHANADRDLMYIALENILGNAWKYTRRSEAARIEFGIQSDGVVFFVRDNGVGFDMAQAAKLFGPFQRFHSPKEFPGTGIGLATVQRIIQRHGGRVWMETKPGSGATLFFTLSEGQKPS